MNNKSCVNKLLRGQLEHMNFKHGRRLGGQPGQAPSQYLRIPHAFITFYDILPPNIWVCPSNIFDKSTPVISNTACNAIGIYSMIQYRASSEI